MLALAAGVVVEILVRAHTPNLENALIRQWVLSDSAAGIGEVIGVITIVSGAACLLAAGLHSGAVSRTGVAGLVILGTTASLVSIAGIALVLVAPVHTGPAPRTSGDIESTGNAVNPPQAPPMASLDGGVVECGHVCVQAGSEVTPPDPLSTCSGGGVWRHEVIDPPTPEGLRERFSCILADY